MLNLACVGAVDFLGDLFVEHCDELGQELLQQITRSRCFLHITNAPHEADDLGRPLLSGRSVSAE